jgi:hypothetical protein
MGVCCHLWWVVLSAPDRLSAAASGPIHRRVVEQSPRLNYRVLGYYGDNEPAMPESGGDRPQIWSQTHNLSDLVQRLQVHELVVAIDGDLGNDLFSCLTECRANGIRVSLMPDFIQQISRKVPIEHIDPNWALQELQDRPVFNPLRLGFKRLLDLGLASVGF